jgi:4-cresol dehydrogenase (hydroxylating)
LVSDTIMLDGFRELVGTEHVIADEPVLRAAETATFATSQRVRAIVRPADTREVQACVRLAATLGVPLHPISRGTNWGYGSRVPVTTGSVLLDLSRMNQIGEVDEELGHVDVEPGVTFRQLHEHLRARGSKLLLCMIGGSPDSSLIGNVVERGIGKGPYGDRFAHVCNFEVVTGSGEIVRTGLGRFAGAKAAPLYRWGLGPRLDGLFSQSRFGIVTRMTQWLMPRPEHFQILFYRVARHELVGEVIDTLRPLVMSGALRPTLTLYNEHRVIATTGTYPFEAAGGRTPLPEPLRASLGASSLLAGHPWGGDIAIYSADRSHGHAIGALVERSLTGKVVQLERVEADAAELDQLLAAPQLDVHAVAPDELLRRGLLRNFLGIPDDASIHSVYWRKPARPAGHLDPDRDRCGLIWHSPVVPFRGRDVMWVLDDMAASLTAHGFEPGLTVQCMSERFVYVVGSIMFDRDVPGEDARALACHDHMQASLLQAGYPPYRVTILGMPTTDDPTSTVVDALAQTLDPAGTLGHRV